MILSVIIPVYNSQKTIGVLVQKLLLTLNHLDFEILLVNDGSKDDSEALCTQLALANRQVTLISLRRNFGEYNAVMCGLNYAKGQYAVMIDDDLQHAPSEIIKLLTTAQTGNFDVVYSQFIEKKHSIFRNFGSMLLNQTSNWLLNKPKDLYLSSFKIIHFDVVQEIIKYKGPYPYLDGLIFHITNSIGTVVVEHQERQSGKSGYSIKKLISLFIRVLIGFSMTPLRLLTIFAIVFFGLSFVLFWSFWSERYRTFLPSSAAIFTVVEWIIAGVQLLGLGLLGEYLGKIFLTQNGLPQYVVKKIIKQ
jgi:undecaprenyl-phosphate 4-deoxy-4-formamido-L-arabinose transferase